MSKAHALIVLAVLLLIFGIVGSMDMEDAQKIEAMRQQLMEFGR